MPFQAMPIAMKANTGSPLSKLIYLYLVERCEIDRYDCWVSVHLLALAAWAQCAPDEAMDAISLLRRQRLIYWVNHDAADQALQLIVNLPVTETPAADRSRLKASDDQYHAFLAMQGNRCATCGAKEEDVGSWHVDHIIPRSIGGRDVEANCQAICGRCNTRKGAKVDWVDFLGGRR